MRNTRLKTCATLGSLFLAIAGGLQAGAITWGTPTDLTGNASDILTSGTFVDSAFLSDDAATVNGVSFNTVSSFLNHTAQFNGSDIVINNIWAYITSPGADQSGWGANYNTLVDRGGYGPNYSDNNAHPQIVIDGLTPGTQYLVQILTGFWNNNWTTAYSDGVNQSDPLNIGVGGASRPQSVTGTFTASESSQQIFAIGITTPNAEMVNGLQVRTLGEAAPEPATLLLVPVGLAGLLVRRRKSSRS